MIRVCVSKYLMNVQIRNWGLQSVGQKLRPCFDFMLSWRCFVNNKVIVVIVQCVKWRVYEDLYKCCVDVEQHYLTQLQDLGLLSFTPSREVEGRRINSYDDR